MILNYLSINSTSQHLWSSGLQIRVRNWKLLSYFSTKTYVVGTKWDGSFEHPKLMFENMDKKIIAILRWIFKHSK